jgi:hypothetical protein
VDIGGGADGSGVGGADGDLLADLQFLQNFLERCKMTSSFEKLKQQMAEIRNLSASPEVDQRSKKSKLPKKTLAEVETQIKNGRKPCGEHTMVEATPVRVPGLRLKPPGRPGSAMR